VTTQRHSMDPTRKTALVAGILYLITYASSIPAALLLSNTLADPSYILGAGADGQIRLAALFDIVNGLTAFGTAVALYSIVKRQHEGLAIGFVASRLFEAAILFIGVVSVVSIAALRETAATATDPAALTAAGMTLVTMYKVAFVLGTAIPALNALLLGVLLFRSRLVPRAIPALGLIGAVTFGVWNVGYVLGVTDPGTPWHGISVAPIFFWELIVGLWMTFKGFNRSAPIVMAAMGAESPPAERTATSVRTDAGVTAKAGAA
jgi:Domain of unknown function (DUF4386)